MLFIVISNLNTEQRKMDLEEQMENIQCIYPQTHLEATLKTTKRLSIGKYRINRDTSTLGNTI